MNLSKLINVKTVEIHEDEWAYGTWTDSNGNENPVRFKRHFDGHYFTDKECEELLAGKMITIDCTRRDYTGHLQYSTYKGNTALRFCPDFSDDFISNPVYDPDIGSNFAEDERREAIVNQFMRLYHYSKMYNSDGTNVKTQYVKEGERQKRGVDVIYSLNEKDYIIDEKAQTDYIYREDGPLASFALELLNSRSGNEGWFVKDGLETEYYMFLWPHADEEVKDASNIEYVEYDLVEKSKLKDFVKSRYTSDERLSEYAKKISTGTLEDTSTNSGKVYYKNAPFDQEGYIVYSPQKYEKPVNLVIKKPLIDEIATESGILRRGDESNEGDK